MSVEGYATTRPQLLLAEIINASYFSYHVPKRVRLES